MSIDKTTLNRIRIAIQHALCSTIHNDINHKSIAEACVDLGIIEKAEDFDTETFDHAPILFEKLWEKIGDSYYKSPLELFEAWGKDEVAIYRLGDELEDFPESALAWEVIFNALSDDEPTSNFLFVGEDFAKLYIDRTVAELNDMQREAFELMRDYIIRKEAVHLGLKKAVQLFGRKKEENEDEEFTTKKGRKFIKMYNPETGEYLGPLVKPMTHEEAHGRKPESPFEFRMDKEAFDKLKYEHDTDGNYVKVTEPSVFDPIEGTLEIKVSKEDAQLLKCLAVYLMKKLNGYLIESLILPYVVDESIRKVSRISELAEIEIITPLLVYSVYKSRYKPAKYPYGASDVIFDIIDSILELKKEGMIQ